MKKYIPSQIEPKWQKKWREEKLYSPDLDKAPKPFYNLMMFPYPSAEGLHVGNMYPFSGSDIYGRYKRMQGFDVFEPIGLDGFGIHSENYALQVSQHPMDLSKITEKRFYEQLMMIGDAYDWSRTVETYKPNYYKWTQWLFLQMFKKGLAYRKKASVNWCPKDKTVLADEQVVAGECERCGSKVELRELEQWFFKITDYAEKLLKNLETIDWSEKVKIAQRNWIGKSEGVMLRFKVKDMDIHFEMFDSVPQTFMAQTFTVIAPEHPMVYELVKGTEHEKPVMEFVEEIKKKKAADKFDLEKEPEGIFTGRYVDYTPTGQSIPIWVASFAIYGYGSGVVNCSVHDERDFAFAKKYNIPLHPVMFPEDPKEAEKVKDLEFCFHHAPDGILQEPVQFKGRKWGEVREDIIRYAEDKGYGKRKAQYHLRDWLISRQRYWGPPIPIIYCDPPAGGCGIVPVPEKDLPVELPYIEDFRPAGKGESPLASVPEFYNVKCPKCGGPARRETDVSDTFLDSAWYFLRYPSTEFEDKSFDKLRTRKWLPVDMYIGGPEHACLHLLYVRFITMVLNDLRLIDFEEPFKTFFAHGLIIKDGAKMSKSKGNVINPDKYIKEYGADTLRTYLMFMGPLSEGGDFRDTGMNGVYRFLQRVWGLQEKLETRDKSLATSDLRMMHKTIKKVTEDIEQLKFNTAIAALMEWLNYLSRKSQESRVTLQEYKTFLLLLAPFAPHITEELWQTVSSLVSDSLVRKNYEPTNKLTNNCSIHKQSWPKFDNKYLVNEEVAVAVQVNGKVRNVLMIKNDIVGNREDVEKMAKENEKIQKFLAGKTVKKVVYVEGKIISFVIGS